jgi:hypothetical protein
VESAPGGGRTVNRPPKPTDLNKLPIVVL